MNPNSMMTPNDNDEALQEKLLNAGDRTKNAVSNTLASAAEKARETGNPTLATAAEKAQQAADSLRDTDVHEMADEARYKAQQVTAQVGEKVEDAVNVTGEKMSDAAQAIRERAPEGKMGEVAVNAADALERSGNYLQQSSTADMRSDLERTIREHPVESLLVGLGVGFLLARAMRK